MASIADQILIKMGLDTSDLKVGLDNAKKEITGTSQGMEQLGAKWKSVASMLARTVIAPVAGFMSLGAVIKSYFGGVAQVAQMTGAYNQKLEDWRKKRAMLARYNKEDIELYKKGREAIVKFQITMDDLSAKIMRSVSPAIKWLIDKLNDFSNWVDKNQNNIVRFLTVVAGVVTALLIPTFYRLAVAMLTNPLTWFIATLGVLILIIDDLVTYLRGGESALGDFWSMFGSPKEILAGLTKAFEILKTVGKALLPVLISFGGLMTAIKVGGVMVRGVIGGLVSTLNMFKTVLTVICAHPIIAFLTLIISLVIWVTKAFNQAGGDWSKVWDILCQDVIDFLNVFGGLGDKIRDFIVKAVGWFSDIGKSIKTWFTDKVTEVAQAWEAFCTTLENWYNKILGWFADIGKAVANAFNFDNITKKMGSVMSKMNPLNWFGGDGEKGAIPSAESMASMQAQQKGNINTSISRQQIFNIETQNPAVSSATLDSANRQMTQEDASIAMASQVPMW